MDDLQKKELEILRAENLALRNRIWDLERRWRSFDPWEHETEDREDG